MNQHIYDAAIVVHIIGITFLSGATVIDFMAFRIFWNSLSGDRYRPMVILETTALCQRIMGIGMGIIILSGVAMMVYMHGVWGEQLWFRIKFGLLLVVIINGLGVRRVLGSKLKKTMDQLPAGIDFKSSLMGHKAKISIVHWIQFILLISIFTLSVFKFN
jgi:hypothetical protein